MTLKIILGTVAVLLILEALFVLGFKKQTHKILKEITRKKNLRKIATYELIIGIIILLVIIII